MRASDPLHSRVVENAKRMRKNKWAIVATLGYFLIYSDAYYLFQFTALRYTGIRKYFARNYFWSASRESQNSTIANTQVDAF
jgi:hypothetical protein